MTLPRWSKSTFYDDWKMVVVVGYDVCCFIQRATIATETVGYACFCSVQILK